MTGAGINGAGIGGFVLDTPCEVDLWCPRCDAMHAVAATREGDTGAVILDDEDAPCPACSTPLIDPDDRPQEAR